MTGTDSQPVAAPYVPASWDTFLQWSDVRHARLLQAADSTRLDFTPKTILLSRGGVREAPADDAPALLAYSDSSWYSCCGGVGYGGYPTWGYGYGYGYGVGIGTGKWRDPYAPDFAPHYDPGFGAGYGPRFGSGFGPGGHRGGRHRPDGPGFGPPGLPTAPSRVELPAMTVPPPARGPALALPAPSAPGKTPQAASPGANPAPRSSRAPARAMPRGNRQ
jgi:hypothetical protein